MSFTTKLYDWATLLIGLSTIPVAIYYYSFEWLVAGILIAFQTFRVMAYRKYSCQLEEEIDQLEDHEMYNHEGDYLGH